MVSEGAWSALSPRQAAGSGYGVCGWCSAGEWRGPVARGLRGTAPGLGRAAGARLTGGEVSQWRGGGGASAQVGGGAWAPRGRERRVQLEVRVVPSCYLACVLSAPMQGRWARYRPAFPAPAPFSQPRPRPRPPGSELLQLSAPGGPATGSPVSTSACSPDSRTRRAAAFQGCRLGSDRVRRITLLEPSATREKPRGAQPGSGSPDSGLLQAAPRAGFTQNWTRPGPRST